MNDPASTAAIGLDVGGTALKCGLVDPHGRVLASSAIPTECAAGVDHVVRRMALIIKEMQAAAAAQRLRVLGVGLGLPGTLDRARGTVIAPPNLTGWRNVPIVERVQSATGLAAVLENDANNAAMGEYTCGAGRGARSMVLMTLGTGIGGGMVLDGKLWTGAMGNAGEVGHMIVEVEGRRCGCGQNGCLEAHASATATTARLIEALAAGEESSLRARLDRNEPITVEAIVNAASVGDPLCQHVWQETCRYLAVACVNLRHICDPELIILAGGMSAAGDALLDPVRQDVERLGSKTHGVTGEIRLARLGNDAGFIGSALSVFRLLAN